MKYNINDKLINAVERGSLPEIKALISKGADVNSSNSLGTALDIACFNGYNECVDYLLKHGADVNYQGEGGYTAVMTALDSGLYIMHALEIINILVQQGADLFLTNDEGETVMDLFRSSLFKMAIDDDDYQQAAAFFKSTSEQQRLLKHVADDARHVPLCLGF